MAERVAIARLGSAGDGVAETEAGPVHVAGALPGEIVTVEPAGARATLVEVEAASPDRVEPFCPYFRRCGGCVAQHVGEPLYSAWKREKVLAALGRAGLPDAPVGPLRDGHGEGRRRVTFHAREIEGAMRVGFMEARSHRLVEIAACPITVPALADAPKQAAQLVRHLSGLRKPLDVAVTATAAGLDIDLRGSGPLGKERRQRLIAEAVALGLARLSLHGEILVEPRQPRIVVGRAEVMLPPGGFLQATAAGEVELAALVLEGCRNAKRIADLFAGIGPFALRLAETAEVHAVEQDARALAALDRAARSTPGLRRITTEARDLFRRPLLPPELKLFDAVVLDPPRAGAEAQVRHLIPSSCDTVIMVSCDPGTFARDATALAAGGFWLERVVPVDQFKWSAHVETVGAFRRTRAAPRRRLRR